MSTPLKNIYNEPLESCGPHCGIIRDGFCYHVKEDLGQHMVCAKVTEEFLTFTKNKGNDLTTPQPYLQFPGLKAGDLWCLCISRWLEAYHAGCAPKIKLAACPVELLDYVSMDILEEYAFTG